ncbi:MAG: histidine kinase [Thermoleophilaceae bacterium]
MSPRGRYASLTRRVVAANATVLMAVAVVTVLVFSPGAVSSPVALKELAILAGALLAMVLLNLALMRRVLHPIEQLRDFVRTVDPLRPGQRVPVEGSDSEASELAVAFNEMLERLERERLESVRMALAAQESERLRVAQELHDEVGQSLTAVLLQLARLAKRLPAAEQPALADTQATARESLARAPPRHPAPPPHRRAETARYPRRMTHRAFSVDRRPPSLVSAPLDRGHRRPGTSLPSKGQGPSRTARMEGVAWLNQSVATDPPAG